MQEFIANNSQEAVELYRKESLRAEYVRRSLTGDDAEGDEPTRALPAGIDRVVPVPAEALDDIKNTVRDYESAVKMLLGHYMAAVEFEKQQGPAGALSASPSGWSSR